MNDAKQVYTTTDPGIAACGLYLGYTLQKVEKVLLDWQFTFQDNAGDFKMLVDDYNNGQQRLSDAKSLLTFYHEILQQIQQRTSPQVEVKEHTGTAEYSVLSVGTAAFLSCNGFRFLRAENAGYSRVRFVFQDDGTAMDYVSQFNTGGLIRAQRFHKALKNMRFEHHNVLRAVKESNPVTDEEAA